MVTSIEPGPRTKPLPNDGWQLRQPERSLQDLALACAMAFIGMLCVLPYFSYSSLGNDEGVTFQGAMRILRGELPYRDFFSFYTPGTFYIHAALFRLFGTTMQAARILLVAYAASFSAITYLLARRMASRPSSVLAAVLLAIAGLPSRFQNLHSWDSTAFAVLALYCAVLYLQWNRWVWSFAAGMLAGITLMMDQSRGAGLILGFVLAVVVLRPAKGSDWSRNLVWPALFGVALAPCTTVIFFWLHHALVPMLQGWLWPLFHYTAAAKLSYGFVFWAPSIREGWSSFSLAQRIFLCIAYSATLAISILPPLVAGLAVAVYRKILLREMERRPLFDFVILIGAVALGSFLSALATSRPDFVRMVYLAPLCFCALPLLLDERLASLPTLSRVQPVLGVYLLVAFAAYGLIMTSVGLSAKSIITTPRGVVRSDRPDEVLPYVLEHVPAGQQMLIYPAAPTYSFLSGTRSPIPYDFLLVGMHTSTDFLIAERVLREDRTPVILLDLTFYAAAPGDFPAIPAEVMAKDPLGDYIQSHYRTCRVLQSGTSRHRPFAYMVRKDLSCPR